MNYYFFQIIIISKYFKVYSGWFSAARILFLGNQNFEESQFENNRQLNKKIYLRLLYSVYGKKINSNSILQNLNSRNRRHFECISERGHADDCANSKTFLQQQVGKDLQCVIESLIQV